MNAIILDMDGTIVDLYGVPHWLKMLENGNAAPYTIAKPMYDSAKLNGILSALQGYGYAVEVVSWLARHDETNVQFDRAVKAAKRQWIKRYLPAIKSSNIHVVKYGTNKWRTSNYKGGTLYDDELTNCREWQRQTSSGAAYQCIEGFDLLGELEALLKDILESR